MMLGEAPEKALAEVAEAMALWLEAARDAGEDVPDPSYRPEIYQKTARNGWLVELSAGYASFGLMPRTKGGRV